MTILITGAKGQLGSELCHLLDERHIAYLAMDSKMLDITNKAMVERVLNEYCPSVIYDCAAYTAVDDAEEEPGKTRNRQVNIIGTRNLAEAAERLGAKLVYISTDYVFDGTSSSMYFEDDEPNPRNEYGRAKYEGEQLVRQIMTEYYIVRTSWVFGEYGKNFVDTMLRLAQTRSTLSVVNDQIGRPTWTRSLSEFITYLIERKAPFGLYQFSNDGECSWYDFAKEILKDTTVSITPVNSEQYPQKAFRPKHSVMSLSKVKSVGFNNISWKIALKLFLQSIKS